MEHIVSVPEDEPLQLIEFIRDTENTQTTIKLVDETLGTITKRAGSRPLSIICICGPSRQGKSFLLGYLIRYLTALETEDTNWFGWEDRKKPLDGFKFQNGTKPETLGIWVWSRPFIVRTDDGKEVAVLLIDTQGTHDEFTTTKEMSSIVGLSLLTSSIMIFNCFNDIQEDVLFSLHNYMQYGQLALDTEGKKAFQKLIFLVRDWNSPEKFPFGQKGGSKFLQEKLRIKPDQPEEAIKVREAIKSCFESLGCYLMPYIGDKALYTKFTGSLSELELIFARNMEQFVTGLVTNEETVTKKVFDEVVTAQDLRGILENYLDIFNSEEMTSGTVFLEACHEYHNGAMLKKSMGKFVDLVKKKMRGKSYIQNDEMEQAMKTAEKAANDMFDKARKFGLKEKIEEWKEKLEDDLTTEKKKFRKANEENRNKYISGAREEAIQKCRKILELELSFEDGQFYEDAFIKRTISEATEEAVKEFVEKLESEEELKEKVGSLELILEQTASNEDNKNKANRAVAEKMMLTLVETLKERFVTEAASAQQENKLIPVEELSPTLNKIIKSISDEFKTTVKPGKKEFQKEFQDKLSKELISAKLEVESSHKLQLPLHRQRVEESYRNAIDQALNHYIEKMKEILSLCDFLSDEDLEEEHLRAMGEALEEYENTEKIDVHDNALNLKAELEEKLNERYQTIMNYNRTQRQLAHSKAENLILQFHSEYQEILIASIEKVRDQAKLEEGHQRATKRVVEKLRLIIPAKDDPIFVEKFLKKLNEEIEDTWEELKDIFEMERTIDETNLKGLLVDCRKYYTNELQIHIDNLSFIRPNVLEELHEQAKKVALDRCKASSPVSTYQESSLEEELEGAFKNVQKRNDMKLNAAYGVAPAIGIDLGTTYCCIAVFLYGQVKYIPNTEQSNAETTPSYVCFKSDGSRTFGYSAKDNAYEDPENTIYDAKRIIGRKMNDEKLQEDMKFWPFEVVEHDGVPKIQVDGKPYFPEQVSAELLGRFRVMAEKFLGVQVEKAVITVPAYFNEYQRQATKDAGELAGLEVLTILNEPTAAAIAYSIDRLDNSARKVLIFDLGGGTFDVAVVEIAAKEIKVLGVDGDTHLGGEDFDKNMMEHCAVKFISEEGVDLLADKDSLDKSDRYDARRRLRRLQTKCEEAKKGLSSGRTATVAVDDMYDGVDLKVEITRDEFEKINATLFQKTITIVEKALNEANIRKEEIEDIVLVGGSTRIPKVQEMLKDYFGGRALNYQIHPDKAVAHGAAVKAAMMNGEQAKYAIVDLGDVSVPVDMPLQLIDFIRNNENAQTTMKIVDKTLRLISKRAGSRPISIICICGPSRQGKNFLLGYLIRYLNALEKGESDWFGWNGRKKPLEGFKFRNGSKPETQGIWVWSKPFIVKTDDAKEVAILLIFTQGTHGEFTTAKEISPIVGLSLLISSIMIFNCFNNIHEDVLSSLNTYMQYGQLVLDIQKEKKAFQKLVFLVRDWNNPGEFPFGPNGGKTFLKEKLRIKEDQPKEAKFVRNAIRNCFGDLECFLMPYAGDKALSCDFTGSVSELDPKFAPRLEQLINSLLNKEEIFAKEILGRCITAEELKEILQLYLEIFNSDRNNSKERVLPKALLEATSRFHNGNVLRRALAKFTDVTRRKMRGSTYIALDEIDDILGLGESAALELFQKESKSSSEAKSLELTKKLQMYLRREKRTLIKSNAASRNSHVQKVTKDTVTNFRSLLDRKFPFDCDQFFEDECIQQTITKAKDQALEDFRDKLDNESEQGLREILETIVSSMDEITTKFVSRNNANRAAVTGMLDSWCRQLKDKLDASAEGKGIKGVSAILGKLDSAFASVLNEPNSNGNQIQHEKNRASPRVLHEVQGSENKLQRGITQVIDKYKSETNYTGIGFKTLDPELIKAKETLLEMCNELEEKMVRGLIVKSLLARERIRIYIQDARQFSYHVNVNLDQVNSKITIMSGFLNKYKVKLQSR